MDYLQQLRFTNGYDPTEEEVDPDDERDIQLFDRNFREDD